MNIPLLKTKFLIIFVFLVSASKSVSAQQKQWQTWNTIGLKVPISKKTDFNFAELGSFLPTNNYSLDFAQTWAGLSYDVTKRFSLKFGDALTYIPGSSNALRNRVFVRGSVDNRFSDVVKAEHGLQVEVHDKNESRYHDRIIFINRLSLIHRFSPLNLRPSLSYILFYNIGGKPIQHFDKTGEPTMVETPDGFHRGRLIAKLNSRINKHFQLNLCYINQREFNLLTPENKQINVYNPYTGKISRPFDDFNTIGISLLFSL